jgi:hypothetical protein
MKTSKYVYMAIKVPTTVMKEKKEKWIGRIELSF